MAQPPHPSSQSQLPDKKKIKFRRSHRRHSLYALKDDKKKNAVSHSKLREKRRLFIKKRGIYLLPNAFTTAALLCGFYAIVQAMNSRFETAAIAIFLAMVLDGMDGRIARLTNTQSAFGEQYDSLSDMVSFGVAPALVIYEWALKDIGRWGWLAAFIYCIGGALRLARFNTNTAVVDKRFFQGLPSPASGALIAGYVWLSIDNRILVNDWPVSWISFALTIYAGITMVTNVPFYSGKALDAKHRVPFGVIVLMVFLFIAVSSNPPIVLFCLFILYGISGYIIWAYQFIKAYLKKRANHIDSRIG